MTEDVSSYLNGKVQDKGHKVTLHDHSDCPVGSQYHSINRAIALTVATLNVCSYITQVNNSKLVFLPSLSLSLSLLLFVTHIQSSPCQPPPSETFKFDGLIRQKGKLLSWDFLIDGSSYPSVHSRTWGKDLA